MRSLYPGEQGQLHELQVKLDRQMVIHDFIKEVLQQDSVDDILWSICNNVISRLDLEDCVIYLVDEDQNLLIQKAAYGPKNPIAQEIAGQLTIPIGEGVVGTVAKTGVSEIIYDTTQDPRYIVDDNFRFSELAVPIIYNEKVIGVIDSEHSEKNFYTQSHLQMLETISSLSATRIGYALAHEELKSYKNQLEQIVSERTQKLNESIKRLHVSNTNLERYAHMVSHDLKSPLRTIGAFIQLIEKTETNLGEKSKEYILLVKDAVSGMSQLLQDILKTSVNNNNKSHDTDIDLNSILERVLNNLKYEIIKNDIEIVHDNNMPHYWGLESQFIQLFQNIISNSIKYKIPNESQKIIISSLQNDSTISIKFRDYGIGVESEFVKTMFELGERGSFEKEGIGIGLYTCKNIVELYGGKISATSEGINKGMEISILLPVVR